MIVPVFEVSRMPIVSMKRMHAPLVAQLHRISIRTGLTAWLGQRFCEQLYLGMAQTPYSFVLVYEDPQGAPLGFICCANNTSKMYRHVLMRRFFPLLWSAMGKLLRPSVLRSIWTSVRRPKTFMSGDYADWHLPEAELISIGVSPEAQGRHIGSELVAAAFQRLRQLGCDRVRVYTSGDNEQATIFYQKRGFKFLGTRPYHSGPIRVFVADLPEANSAKT